MLASMDGQEYSPKVTCPLWMEKKFLWTILYPYVSGLFHGSQLNWAALTKEVYAIYMSVKKSTFYLTGHEITLRSDHLPLKKFLRKMTLNNMVKEFRMTIDISKGVNVSLAILNSS